MVTTPVSVPLGVTTAGPTDLMFGIAYLFILLMLATINVIIVNLDRFVSCKLFRGILSIFPAHLQ